MNSHPTLLDLKLQGLWLGSRMIVQHLYSSVALTMNSAALTEDVISAQVAAVHFVQRNLNVFAFKSSHLRLSLQIVI
jgi:hypothetical protein